MILRLNILLLFSAVSTLAADDGTAKVLQYDFQRNGDAEYLYSFETSNGIKRNETGEEAPSIHNSNANVALVKGSFSFTGADGVLYSVNYVADEAGFHPEGEHLNIPPFTPWIPGQPVDDGQYKEDHSGEYKTDNSGKYKDSEGENNDSPILTPNQKQKNFTPEGRLRNNLRPAPPIEKYNPTKKPQETHYVTGESILDTFLRAKTPKYVPASSTIRSYTSDENLLDGFRESSRPTPKYLPSEATDSNRINLFTTASPLDSDFIKKAFFNSPTPHPDISLRSTPSDRSGLKVGEASQNKFTYLKRPDGKTSDKKVKRRRKA